VGGVTRTLFGRSRCSVQVLRAAVRGTVVSDQLVGVALLAGDALRMRAGARCVRSMAGRDSTNRLGEGTVGAPPGGIDYVGALPGCCQRPRRGGRSRRSRFGHLRRSVFGAVGAYVGLACMVSEHYWGSRCSTPTPRFARYRCSPFRTVEWAVHPLCGPRLLAQGWLPVRIGSPGAENDHPVRSDLGQCPG